MKDKNLAFKLAGNQANLLDKFYSVVRVSNGQFMLELTSLLSADYGYYERWDFAPYNKWPDCAVCGHISQMHDIDGNCREKNCSCTGYRTIAEPWKNPSKSLEVKFIMDCYGHFCIEVDGTKSEPAGYQHIAQLQKGNTLYIGVSHYYNGVLPVECVLKVEKVKTVLADSEVCNMLHPEDPCTHTSIKVERKSFEERLAANRKGVVCKLCGAPLVNEHCPNVICPGK